MNKLKRTALFAVATGLAAGGAYKTYEHTHDPYDHERSYVMTQRQVAQVNAAATEGTYGLRGLHNATLGRSNMRFPGHSAEATLARSLVTDETSFAALPTEDGSELAASIHFKNLAAETHSTALFENPESNLLDDPTADRIEAFLRNPNTHIVKLTQSYSDELDGTCQTEVTFVDNRITQKYGGEDWECLPDRGTNEFVDSLKTDLQYS